MSCQKCVGKVERALLATHGVSTCQIELEAGIATVKGQVDETRVRKAIEAAGYVTR
jgi:copper chaperone CopZ